jgi:hypothetical protein
LTTLYAALPLVPGNASKVVFLSFQRLVTAMEENEKRTRIEDQDISR